MTFGYRACVIGCPPSNISTQKWLQGGPQQKPFISSRGPNNSIEVWNDFSYPFIRPFIGIIILLIMGRGPPWGGGTTKMASEKDGASASKTLVEVSKNHGKPNDIARVHVMWRVAPNRWHWKTERHMWTVGVQPLLMFWNMHNLFWAEWCWHETSSVSS